MANTKHRPIPKLSASDIERFWDKVEIRSCDECWPWKAARFYQNGYGAFQINRTGEVKAAMRSNRMAYYVCYGIDPMDKLVCHTCDNRGCCNPSHLFLGTTLDNAQDMVKKGRQARGDRSGRRLHPERFASLTKENHWSLKHPEKVRKGENHYNAKFTDVEVVAIRDHRTMGWSTKAISAKFGISLSHALRIFNKQNRII